MGLGIIMFQHQDLLELFCRLLMFSYRFKGVSQVEVGIGEVGFKLQRLLVMFDRLRGCPVLSKIVPKLLWISAKSG